MQRLSFGVVELDVLSHANLLEHLPERIATRSPSQIVTLNALMYNEAHHAASVSDVIKRSSLVIADSIGVVAAARYLYGRSIDRIAGIDLIDDLCTMAISQHWRLYLLGSTQEVVSRTADNLSRRFPGLIIAGYEHGYFTPQEEKGVVERIKTAHPDILLVGFNIPHQEVWIAQQLKELGVPLVMGVGGSFDVIAGKLKRAPRWMQRRGLEWLFRLMQEPWRIKRIMNLPSFIYYILKDKYLPSPAAADTQVSRCKESL